MRSFGIDDGLDENRQQPFHVSKHRPGRFASRLQPRDIRFWQSVHSKQF